MNFADLFDALRDFMALDSGIFIPLAKSWFHVITLITLVLLGIAWMQDGWSWPRINKFIVTYVVIGAALVNWGGASHLITDEMRALRIMLDHGQESTIFNAVTDAQAKIDAAQPIIPTVRDWLIIGLLTLALSALEALVFFAIAFGYIATAICMVIGPLFIVWAMAPGLEWVSWGWFRAFLGYASYPVIAAAYCDVAARMITFYFAAHPAPWSMGDLWRMLGPFVMMIIAIALGAFQIPSLAASIWAGRTGESAVPKFIVRRF